MPYGITEKDLQSIQNELVLKLYATNHYDRPSLVVEYTDSKLKEALAELQGMPMSEGKIEIIEKELERRKGKTKKSPFFSSHTAEDRFKKEWTEACRRIRGEVER